MSVHAERTRIRPFGSDRKSQILAMILLTVRQYGGTEGSEFKFRRSDQQKFLMVSESTALATEFVPPN